MEYNIKEVFEQFYRYTREQQERIDYLEKRVSLLERTVSAFSGAFSGTCIEPVSLESRTSSDEPEQAFIDEPQKGGLLKKVYYSARATQSEKETYFEQSSFKSTPYYYIIEVMGDQATYRLNVEDEEFQKRYVNEFETIINGTCKMEGLLKNTGRFCNVREGKLHRKGEKWMIDEFLMVKFE